MHRPADVPGVPEPDFKKQHDNSIGRQGGHGGGRDARCWTRHRGAIGSGGRDRLRYRAKQRFRTVGDEPAGDDRRDGGPRGSGRRPRHRGAGRPSRPRRGAGAGQRASNTNRASCTSWSTTSGAPPGWSGTRPVWESSLDYGLRTLRLAVDTHAITSHFAMPLLIATPGGLVVEVTDGTDDYNADQLPGLLLLRHRQGGGEPHGVRAGARAKAPWRDGGVADAGLAAFGSDAGGLSASPRRTGATPPRFSLTSPFQRAPLSSAAPSRRSRGIPRCRAGTENHCRAASWRRSTASPTSTAASPTPGDTSSRCRTPASRLTSPAIAEIALCL